MDIPSITGVDVLRAINASAEGLSSGAPFTISQFDALDLHKLRFEDLTSFEFQFSAEVADRIVSGLSQGDFSELSNALGIRLIVDKKRIESLIKNAGIIRSAGGWSDDPQSLQEMLSFFDNLRHHNGH